MLTLCYLFLTFLIPLFPFIFFSVLSLISLLWLIFLFLFSVFDIFSFLMLSLLKYDVPLFSVITAFPLTHLSIPLFGFVDAIFFSDFATVADFSDVTSFVFFWLICSIYLVIYPDNVIFCSCCFSFTCLNWFVCKYDFFVCLFCFFFVVASVDVEICPVTRLCNVQPLDWKQWRWWNKRMSWYKTWVKDDKFPQWVQFLNLCVRAPVFLKDIAY